MCKQFVEGNVYAFSRKKYLQDRRFRGSCKQDYWPKKANGNIVIIDNVDEGHCGPSEFDVVPEWCVCIKEGK